MYCISIVLWAKQEYSNFLLLCGITLENNAPQRKIKCILFSFIVKGYPTHNNMDEAQHNMLYKIK